MKRLRRAVLILLALLAAQPSLANAEPALSANVALVSDYRFRGVSLSEGDHAVQAGVDLEGARFFAGAWASSIADYGGANTEVDLYAGILGGSGSVAWRAGAYAYLYPGGAGVNYVELMARADKAIGPITIGMETAFVPAQNNVEASNLYLGASSSIDIVPGVTLLVRGGYENGFYDRKWDWELGLAYAPDPLEISLSYIDTSLTSRDDEAAKGALVASLSLGF